MITGLGEAEQGALVVQEAQVTRRALARRPEHALHPLPAKHFDAPVRGAHLAVIQHLCDHCLNVI